MSNENKNEVIVQEPTVNLPALSNPQEVFEILQENMQGETPEFERVKIPSGGGLAFEVPGDNPEEPESVKELEGVILDHYPVRAYWKNNYTGENNPPDCSSMDGRVGQALEDAPVKWAGKMQDCSTCPFNQWGSADEGNGKACKGMHRVYILREGEIFPVLLTLPPTSVKHLTSYMARLSGKMKRYYGVLTKVKLKKATNKGGIVYSEAIFGRKKDLTSEETKAMKKFSDQLKGAMRDVIIDMADYDVEGNNSNHTVNQHTNEPEEDIM